MVKKTAKIAGSIVGGIVGAVALVLIAYAIYVMTAYYDRVPNVGVRAPLN